MKITDGKKTVEIEIRKWTQTGWAPDWSIDFFEAGSLPYDEETETYTVEDVDYCIEAACDTSDEGACVMWDEEGFASPDPDMKVIVDGEIVN